MNTFTANPSCHLPGWLKRSSSALQKVSRLKSMTLILICTFLLSLVSFGQTEKLKKGYSKADYLIVKQKVKDQSFILNEKSEEHISQQFQQQQKVLFPESTEEKCGTTYVEEILKKLYPNRPTTEEFEKWMQNKIVKGEYDASRSVKTIPVVVHIIHNGEDVGTGPNITEEQVLSQIAVMNEDFRRLNADADNTPDIFAGIAADAELEFCLANVTPDGAETNGITRYNGGQTSYSVSSMETTIKPATIWEPNYYFNIWVCNLSTYLGYAQFPDDSGLSGLPPDIDQDGTENTDGIVIKHTSFGTTGTASSPYHLGRTATHEAGHFFGLRHIWGDKQDGLYSCSIDDYCDDTPSQYNANFTGSPCTYPGPNSCDDGDGDLSDQFMNFLDYSNDICMNMFTEDQKTRFNVVISNSPRRNFEHSQVCNGTPPPSTDPPLNDLCENALPLSCDESVTGSTVYATFDDVEFCGTSNTTPGIWYSFEVLTASYVNLSTCNDANFDTKISVYKGTCDALECVGGRDDATGCEDFTTELEVYAEPGETYYVLVHGFLIATGEFTLTMSCREIPENDLCENALPITCDESIEGTSIDALFDDVGFCGTSNTAPGVWYSFVATDYNTNLSTCNQAGFDTKISVFTGSCDLLECVGGQDDAEGCADFTTNLNVRTVPGEIYYVLVHGFGGATGDFTLTMTCIPPPDNDLCEGALPILCGDVVYGNTEFATNIDAQDDCTEDAFDLTPGFGVWYTLDGTGGDIVLSTCNDANYDTRIDVYTGTCGDLVCFAGNDDESGCSGFTSELTFASIEGETYYIYVNGFGSAYGDFTLTVSCCVVAEAGDCATVYWGYEPAECTDLVAEFTYGMPPISYEWSDGDVVIGTTETITVCPTFTTTYYITITDGYGCVSTDEVTVEVIDVRCGNKLKKVEICHIPPDNPDNPQTICVSANAVLDHLQHGDHLGSCGIEPCDGLYMSTFELKNASLGQVPRLTIDDWNIYPNPANDIALIELSMLYGYDVHLTILDVSGKVYWNYPMKTLESKIIEVDMNTAPSGIYHVVLRTEKQSIVKKLVITQ